jgi:glutamyl-tRNA reductase
LYVDTAVADALRRGAGWAGVARLDGRDAAAHLLGVAIGLESAVLGEDQVLHQLRRSVAAARVRGTLPEALDILFDLALRAGRIARSWRPHRPRSLADLAVTRLAGGDGESLAGCRVLVVGAGEMGRLAAISAAARGATLSVASPTYAHAQAVATTLGGTAVRSTQGHSVSRLIDWWLRFRVRGMPARRPWKRWPGSRRSLTFQCRLRFRPRSQSNLERVTSTSTSS